VSAASFGSEKNAYVVSSGIGLGSAVTITGTITPIAVS